MLCTRSSQSPISDIWSFITIVYLRIICLYSVPFLSNDYPPPRKHPLRNKLLVNPVPCGIVHPPKTFSTINPKLVIFYLALMWHELLYIAPTPTVIIKPISYSYAKCRTMLLILIRMSPMSFFTTHFQNTLFLVGTTWSGTPFRLRENLSSSSGLLGATYMVLCTI